MPTSPRWMLYGAYGFTGRLIAAEAVRRGHRPVLAGRNAGRLAAMAGPLGLEHRAFDLADPAAVAAAVRATPLAVNAAGPFSETGGPLIEACLAVGAGYLDISGEMHHLRSVLALDQRARRAGVALVTGAGFGVTYGDCLARHVADRLPDATHLRLTVAAANAQTTGAVRRTILEVMSKGGFAVEDGQLRARPLGHALWTVADAGAEVECVAAPMGELAALAGWTRIPNILVGRPMSHATARRIRRVSPLIQGALGFSPLRNRLGRDRGEAPAPLPTPAGGWRSKLWAEARNGRGDRFAARLDTGEGYEATARAALANIEALLDRRLAGAFTPASAFGADHVRGIEGVRMADEDSSGSDRKISAPELAHA